MVRSLLLIIFLSVSVSFLISCKEEKKLSSGFIDADYVYISAYESGILEKLYVARGQEVKVGQKLFETDIHQADANLETFKHIELAAASAYEGSGIGYNMYKKLTSVNAAAEKDLWFVEHVHRAIGELEKAVQSQIKYKKWLLEQTIQTSPYNAIVFDILYRKGENVQNGKPVVVLLPPENIKAVFFVNGDIAGKLKLGSKVSVATGDTKTVAAEVSYISPKPEYTDPFIYSLKNNKKFMYMIEARFAAKDSQNLHPGQPVEVDIN